MRYKQGKFLLPKRLFWLLFLFLFTTSTNQLSSSQSNCKNLLFMQHNKCRQVAGRGLSAQRHLGSISPTFWRKVQMCCHVMLCHLVSLIKQHPTLPENTTRSYAQLLHQKDQRKPSAKKTTCRMLIKLTPCFFFLFETSKRTREIETNR